MIQDINTHKLDIVYDGKAILEESDLIVAFSEKDVYMKKQQEGEAEQFLVCSDIFRWNTDRRLWNDTGKLPCICFVWMERGCFCCRTGI